MLNRLEPMNVVLNPTKGEIHAHIFENPQIGLVRNLFWNLYIAFGPVRWDDEEWSCSLLVDWLTWPLSNWQDLYKMDLEQVINPELVECSLYLFNQHNWATLKGLKVTRTEKNHFSVSIDAVADVDTGNDQRSVPVSIVCSSIFTGIIVVPENLEPKPATVHEVQETVRQFIGLDRLTQPRLDQWRWLFKPS